MFHESLSLQFVLLTFQQNSIRTAQERQGFSFAVFQHSLYASREANGREIEAWVLRVSSPFTCRTPAGWYCPPRPRLLWENAVQSATLPSLLGPFALVTWS